MEDGVFGNFLNRPEDIFYLPKGTIGFRVSGFGALGCQRFRIYVAWSWSTVSDRDGLYLNTCRGVSALPKGS